jgi:hypothetical protein
MGPRYPVASGSAQAPQTLAGEIVRPHEAAVRLVENRLAGSLVED